jgi:hypothetical protein
MLHRLLVGLIVAAAYLSPSVAWAVPLPKIEERPKTTRTVIPGTWTWNIETNKLGANNKPDLWWCQHQGKERSLETKNGAAMAIVPIAFEKVDLACLKSVKFDKQKISASDNNNQLQPGTVLAVRTANGNYAKLRVVRYYRMHDFSFPGSSVLNEQWKKFVLSLPDQDFYNIEFEWVFYKAE